MAISVFETLNKETEELPTLMAVLTATVVMMR